MCHVLHHSCNVNAAVADSLRCRMICGTDKAKVKKANLYTCSALLYPVSKALRYRAHAHSSLSAGSNNYERRAAAGPSTHFTSTEMMFVQQTALRVVQDKMRQDKIMHKI